MRVNNLSFRHHKQAAIFFDGLSFSLEKGKLHALHGKNGTGKTVLLNILNQTPPQESILHGELTGFDKTLLVNQSFDKMIADQFSFKENLQFACMQCYPRPFLPLAKPNMYSSLLESFGIDIFQPVYKLSGGQRQILSLLMALQQNRSLLLLDEPTATLDEDNARMVFNFLRCLAHQGMTLLVVCHDPELIHYYVDGSHLYLEKDPSGTRKLSICTKDTASLLS